MSAKALRVVRISRSAANAFIKRHHYSHSFVLNSSVHLGVLWNGVLEGAMQFGPSLDQSKTIRLVRDTKPGGFLELNRLAFSEALPRNSESRAIAVAMRLIRKNLPRVEWVLSYADATRCGDGTIYRASGFVLVGVKKNKSILQMPSGEVVHEMTLKVGARRDQFHAVTNGSNSMGRFLKASGAAPLAGFQVRYIYFLNPQARDRLDVPLLPFSALDEIGARMYRGSKPQAGEAKQITQPVPTGKLEAQVLPARSSKEGNT